MMSSEHPATLPRFPRPYTKRFVLRAIVLWFLVRLVVLVLVVLWILAGSGGALQALLDAPLIAASPQIAAMIAATVAGLAAIDLHATRENILIANLGLSPARALLLMALIAFVLEIAVLIGTIV